MSHLAWRLPCGLCSFAVEVYADKHGNQGPRAGENAYWSMQEHIRQVHGETCADCGRVSHDLEQVQPDGRYVCLEGLCLKDAAPAVVVGIGEQRLFEPQSSDYRSEDSDAR